MAELIDSQLEESSSGQEFQEIKNSLIVDGKEVHINNLSINDRITSFVSRYFNHNSKKAANQFLRQELKNSEYLGICIVNKFSFSGYLIKISESFYVVLSLNLQKVLYSSTTIDDFHLIESPSNYFVVVNGKEYDISEIELSNHFIKQASDRFRVPIESIKSLFFDIVVNGKYICITHCKEHYKPAHLFCKDGKLVYISLDFKVAITTYYNPMNASTTQQNIKEKIENLLLKEIKKLVKIEEKINKRNTKEKLENNLKIAQLELELYNTRSEIKSKEIQSEIYSLKNYLEIIEEEWNEIVDDIRRHAIALSAFV